MAYAFAEIAFTDAVRRRQQENGGSAYARFLDADRDGGDRLGLQEAAFIEAQDGFYQATVSQTGWPYVQFRGGPRGFLRVLDDQTLAYADLRGNRQYISLGNLDGNDRVALILVDYLNAMRLKLWGRVEVTQPGAEDWASLPPALRPEGAQRLVRIHVEAFDWNCPKNIPRRLNESEVDTLVDGLRSENNRLRREVQMLRAAMTTLSNEAAG